MTVRNNESLCKIRSSFGSFVRLDGTFSFVQVGKRNERQCAEFIDDESVERRVVESFDYGAKFAEFNDECSSDGRRIDADGRVAKSLRTAALRSAAEGK